MRQVVASHPDRPVAVLLQGYDVEHSLEMLVLQGICRPAQLARTAQWMPDRDPFFRGKNPPPPPPGSLLTVWRYETGLSTHVRISKLERLLSIPNHFSVFDGRFVRIESH